jgi:hypothetical protein
MAIQPEGGFSGKAGNINAPRQIVIAISNAGINRVLEEVILGPIIRQPRRNF